MPFGKALTAALFRLILSLSLRSKEVGSCRMLCRSACTHTAFRPLDTQQNVPSAFVLTPGIRRSNTSTIVAENPELSIQRVFLYFFPCWNNCAGAGEVALGVQCRGAGIGEGGAGGGGCNLRLQRARSPERRSGRTGGAPACRPPLKLRPPAWSFAGRHHSANFQGEGTSPRADAVTSRPLAPLKAEHGQPARHCATITRQSLCGSLSAAVPLRPRTASCHWTCRFSWWTHAALPGVLPGLQQCPPILSLGPPEESCQILSGVLALFRKISVFNMYLE